MSNRKKIRPAVAQSTFTSTQTDLADVLLVVGNGLSLSLKSAVSPALDTWHTSYPLEWNATIPSDSGPNISIGSPLIDLFPRAKMVIDAARLKLPSRSDDFKVLNTARELVATLEEDEKTEAIVELRHLIALSYSAYQSAADGVVKRGWPLGGQITRLAQSGRILGAISLNYDLNLEMLFHEAGMAAKHVAADLLERGDIAISKPHGSINYAPDERVYQLPQEMLEYPRKFFAEGTNSPIRLLSSAEMTKTRLAVDLVLPAERSGIERFQWVEAGNRWLSAIAARVRKLVIIGVSYMDVDRGELDAIFSSLHRDTVAVVIDPNPNVDLLQRLRGLYRSEPLQNIDLSTLHSRHSGPNRRDRRHPTRL